MAVQPTQTPSLSGAALTHAACAAGDTFINNGRTWISVKNTDGSSHTATVTCTGPCSYGSASPAHDVVLTVPAGTEQILGPFDTTRFNGDGVHAALVYSAVTGMTIAVFST